MDYTVQVNPSDVMYELSKIEINEWHNNADTKSAIEQNLILDYRRLEGLISESNRS